MEQQLADAAKEADDMAVAQRVPFLVPHRFEELVDPDAGVDGEAFFVEGRQGRGPRKGGEDGPEAGDAHGGLVRRVIGRRERPGEGVELDGRWVESSWPLVVEIQQEVVEGEGRRGGIYKAAARGRVGRRARRKEVVGLLCT